MIRVHLRGHFCPASHAVQFWRGEQKAGRPVDARIINTSSGAGLQGSFSQSAYSAAKGGIASLTLVQAAELGRYGVTANALAPAARTRMTEQAFAERMKKPAAGFDVQDPENIAPTVVWLGSRDSRGVTGCVFELEGGRITLCDGWNDGPSRRQGITLVAGGGGAGGRGAAGRAAAAEEGVGHLRPDTCTSRSPKNRR